VSDYRDERAHPMMRAAAVRMYSLPRSALGGTGETSNSGASGLAERMVVAYVLYGAILRDAACDSALAGSWSRRSDMARTPSSLTVVVGASAPRHRVDRTGPR
jgi:hypothetical protein